MAGPIFYTFHDSTLIYVCALLYFILILAPQGGVKNKEEGRNNNNLNLIVDITHYYRYTHHIHITHETCLLRQVGLQYYTSQDKIISHNIIHDLVIYNMIITI